MAIGASKFQQDGTVRRLDSRRRRCVVGDVLSRGRRDSAVRCAFAASVATARRATSPSSTCCARWAPTVHVDDDFVEVRSARLRGDRPRPERNTRCRDDGGSAGTVRRRHHADPQHRELAREGNRPALRDGDRTAQARRARRRRRRLHRGHSPGTRSRPRRSIRMAIIGWRCAFRSRRSAACR